jgi:hypothetical protein
MWEADEVLLAILKDHRERDIYVVEWVKGRIPAAVNDMLAEVELAIREFYD